MNSSKLLTVERKKNKKGQKYYVITYGNGEEIFDTLDEALAQVVPIARFVDAVESLPVK